ncbi:hypothetical protein LIER_31430 [Lithospermum erythrorhizon]|uniref:Uncharacterized protein n=1 Tax=Lithospermum erythrorhizon TaxID=34254 RepID=A0AAV3RTA5_LITER
MRQDDPSMRRKSQWHNPNRGSNRDFNEHGKTRKEQRRHYLVNLVAGVIRDEFNHNLDEDVKNLSGGG